ncbi:MAG: hypothetical protein N2C14_27845, partial [Planctomycetales bacterium]
TMTVEFLGDALVAHVDRDHVALAQHPIIDNERTYLAFQADESAAAFDNFQIFTAAKHKRHAENLARAQSLADRFPVKKTVAEEYEIQKRNAHEWFYPRDTG